MKKKLWLMAVAAFAAFALLFTACPGGGGGESDPLEFPPRFLDAQMLTVQYFDNMHANPPYGTVRHQWQFAHWGAGVDDEDNPPEPHRPRTLLNSTFLIIASRGGGDVVGIADNEPATQFNGSGFQSVAFKVDATNTVPVWGHYVSRTFVPQEAFGIGRIPFEHRSDEIVFFVFDLEPLTAHLRHTSGFGTMGTLEINYEGSEIVIPIEWDGMIYVFGEFQAYITSANLTMGGPGSGDVEIRNDPFGGSTAPAGRIGWITRHIGLTPAP